MRSDRAVQHPPEYTDPCRYNVRYWPPDPPITPTPRTDAIEWRWDGVSRVDRDRPSWQHHHCDVRDADPGVLWDFRIDPSYRSDRGWPLRFANAEPDALVLAQAKPTQDCSVAFAHVQADGFSEQHGMVTGPKILFVQAWHYDGTIHLGLEGKIVDPARWQPNRRFGPMLSGPGWYFRWRLIFDGLVWCPSGSNIPEWTLPRLIEDQTKAIAWYERLLAGRRNDPGGIVPFDDMPRPIRFLSEREMGDTVYVARQGPVGPLACMGALARRL